MIEELGSTPTSSSASTGPSRYSVEEAGSREEDDEATLLADSGDAFFTARVDARTTARVGDTVRLAVDPSRFYFFSPETRETLLRTAA